MLLERLINALKIDEVEGSKGSQLIELVANGLKRRTSNRRGSQYPNVDIGASIRSAGCLGTEDEECVPRQIEMALHHVTNRLTKLATSQHWPRLRLGQPHARILDHALAIH